MKYVYNRPDQPWLLMFVQSPWSSNSEHYQTHEVIMARIYCGCKALGINLGMLDFVKNEMIFESFTIKEGEYGMGVPYYIYVKGGKAVHLQ